MSFHRNAKLGLAGRYALVRRSRAADDGRRQPPSASRRRPRTAGGIAGWRRARRRGETLCASLDRSSRPHRSPRRLAPELEQRICGAGGRRAGGRGWSPARPACPLDGLEGAPARGALAAAAATTRAEPTATSGPAPATCCTWTRASYARFRGPATRVTGDRSDQDASQRPDGSTSCTRSSTTTRGSPTSSSTRRARRRPSSASSNARSPSSPATGSPRSG